MNAESFIAKLVEAFPGIESSAVEYNAGEPDDVSAITVYLDGLVFDGVEYEDWEIEIELVDGLTIPQWEYRIADEDGDLVSHGKVARAEDAPAEIAAAIRAN